MKMKTWFLQQVRVNLHTEVEPGIGVFFCCSLKNAAMIKLKELSRLGTWPCMA